MLKQLLCTYGFGYVWLEQQVGNEKDFSELFQTRVKDIFIQNWHSELVDSPRARCYLLFTNEFGYKSHLDTLNIEKYRKL